MARRHVEWAERQTPPSPQAKLILLLLARRADARTGDLLIDEAELSRMSMVDQGDLWPLIKAQLQHVYIGCSNICGIYNVHISTVWTPR